MSRTDVACLRYFRLYSVQCHVWYVAHLFFFFKQKTAYELRIRDWSSDVCSSDLAMARGEGPARSTVALGCAGWGAGQLEYELTENSWLTVPADAELLFATPLDARWQAAAGRLGVDMTRVADYSGHA